MKLIVFSSPLHYLVGLLVRKISNEPCVGFYIQHSKNCDSIFKKIEDKLNISLEYTNNVNELKDFANVSEIIVSNRFDADQVSMVQKYKGKAIVSFMEEGASIYLKESHLGMGIRDDNYWLRIKEFLRPLLGKPRYFIPMSWFKRGYSFCAADIPNLSKFCAITNLTPTFLKLVGENQAKKYCSSASARKKRAIILSQWFVAKGILSEVEMMSFYEWMHTNVMTDYDEIYYKPHPWDSEDFTASIKNNFGYLTVDDEEIPVEIWLALHGDITLFGFWTSTMIYCGTVLPNKAISALYALASHSQNEKIKHQYTVSRELLHKAKVKELSYNET